MLDVVLLVLMFERRYRDEDAVLQVRDEKQEPGGEFEAYKNMIGPDAPMGSRVNGNLNRSQRFGRCRSFV